MKTPISLSRIFGNRAQSVVDELIKGDIVQTAIAAAETANYDKRARLVEQLRTAPERHEPGIIKANKALSAAQADIEAAKKALDAAQAKQQAALVHNMSLSAIFDAERSMLERELETTADPRLEAFAQACLQLRGEVHVMDPIFVIGAQDRLTADASHLDTAMRALSSAATRARALRLQSLSSDQVKAELQKLADSLAAPLARVKRSPPTPDAMHESAGISIVLH